MRGITTLAAHRSFAAVFALILIWTGIGLAQTTSFTYQGRLTDGGSPANGNYDLQFALFDGASSVNSIGSTLMRSGTSVSNGIFTVQLDFGVNAFPGANRFLEIAVRPAGSGNFTTLSPRQQISSTPYAIRTLNATAADSLSSACVGCVQDSQINSVAGSKVSGTIPLAAVPAGSTSYIQNSSSLQTAANFNIGGDGFIGGNFGMGVTNPLTKFELIGGTAFCGAAAIRFGNYREQPCGNALTITTADPAYNFIQGLNSTVGTVFAATGTGGIYAADYVGIGTGPGTTPQSKLSVKAPSPGYGITHTDGTVTIGSYIGSGAGWLGTKSNHPLYFFTNDSGSRITLDTLGNVGINTLSPDQRLTVNGNASKPGGGSWAIFSDERLKNIKGPFTTGLKALMRLQPIRFEYKRENALALDAAGEYIGFGAHAVQEIIPEAVTKNDKGYLLVNNDPIMWTMLNAIKEQQTQIERQQKQIEGLKWLVCRFQPLRRGCK